MACMVNTKGSNFRPDTILVGELFVGQQITGYVCITRATIDKVEKALKNYDFEILVKFKAFYGFYFDHEEQDIWKDRAQKKAYDAELHRKVVDELLKYRNDVQAHEAYHQLMGELWAAGLRSSGISQVPTLNGDNLTQAMISHVTSIYQQNNTAVAMAREKRAIGSVIEAAWEAEFEKIEKSDRSEELEGMKIKLEATNSKLEATEARLEAEKAKNKALEAELRVLKGKEIQHINTDISQTRSTKRNLKGSPNKLKRSFDPSSAEPEVLHKKQCKDVTKAHDDHGQHQANSSVGSHRSPLKHGGRSARKKSTGSNGST